MSTLHLRELSRHTFAKAISADKTVICSPHELIAIVTHVDDVVVYRLNGQIAFTIKNPQDDEEVEEEDRIKVTRVEWSPDGRRLAVAWSDGTWRVHEAEKGDPVFESSVRDNDNELDSTVVLGMSWQKHQIHSQREEEGALPSEDLPADFPRDITLFDVTNVLPRLSALPAHGLRMSTEGAKFAHQSSMDSIFASVVPHGSEKVVEVLLIHASDSTVKVMLNGTSHVGTANTSIGLDCALYASNEAAASHVLVTTAEHSRLHLELLDLPLNELNGAILHLTSHSTMQLSSLIQYVRRTTQCITHDYTSGIALPARLINNISMTLEDNPESSSTLSSALIHLAMTGQFHPDVLEWLIDIVKDTGLKRWDTSISTMYSSIQTHLHSHTLPAIEGMVIAASKLRGLARLHQGNAAFTPDEKLFSAIIDTADAMRRTALRGMHICINEWTSWRMFSRWLKMQIEVASAGPNTKEAAETEEREGLGLEFMTIVQYIQSILANGSALQSFVKSVAKADDLTNLTISLDKAIGAALESVTIWQSRLFTVTRAVTLDNISHPVTDIVLRPSDQAGSLSLSVSALSEQSTINLNTFSIPGKDEPRTLHAISTVQTREGVIAATFYRSGSKLLCLEHSTDTSSEGLQLTTVDIATNKAKVLHLFDNKTYASPERIAVAGREGKEFCVVFGQGHRSWTVLDLHADTSTDEMSVDVREMNGSRIVAQV